MRNGGSTIAQLSQSGFQAGEDKVWNPYLIYFFIVLLMSPGFGQLSAQEDQTSPGTTGRSSTELVSSDNRGAGNNLMGLIDLYRQELWYPEDQGLLVELDPTRLEMKTDYDSRAYLLGLTPRYQETLGLSPAESGSPAGATPSRTSLSRSRFPAPQLNEPPSSSSGSDRGGLGFVDLGNLQGGTVLDFFMISEAVSRGSGLFNLTQGNGSRSMQQVIAYAVPDSPYLLLAFANAFGGGQQNFMDMVIALEIGMENVRALSFLASTPEASEYAMMAIFIFMGYRTMRKNHSRQGRGQDPVQEITHNKTQQK